MSEINYCEKCHLRKRSISYKAAKERIKSVTNSDIIENCNSMCGPGLRQFIAEYKGDIIAAQTFEELIQDIKDENEN